MPIRPLASPLFPGFFNDCTVERHTSSIVLGISRYLVKKCKNNYFLSLFFVFTHVLLPHYFLVQASFTHLISVIFNCTLVIPCQVLNWGTKAILILPVPLGGKNLGVWRKELNRSARLNPIAS